MKPPKSLVAGLLLGAGLMYLLDPDHGIRRRSIARDRLGRARRRMGEGLSATARDVKNRSSGALAELRSRLEGDEADDAVIEERIRARLGRLVSHPGAVEVAVIRGEATLLGTVLEDELEELVIGVARVRGVTRVWNQLEVSAEPDGVPALQARAPRGRRRRRRTIDVRKTMDVAVPLDEVWALWSDFSRFPRFMTHLRDVTVAGPDLSHWVATGPLGTAVEWDAEITDWRERERIAWRSVEGSQVETAGEVRFRRRGDGGTRIELRLSCAPPAGALGEAVAAFFGSHPKRQIDDDLVRLKSLLETGQTRAGQGRVHLEDVQSGEVRGSEGPSS
ncbi:MAG: SRPBCC family protein [Gemmatimonadales bacterium]